MITSPERRPALAAGPLGVTELTSAPIESVSRARRLTEIPKRARRLVRT